MEVTVLEAREKQLLNKAPTPYCTEARKRVVVNTSDSISSSPIEPWFLSISVGLLYALLFPPFSWHLVGWFALVPLLVVALRSSPLRASLFGLVSGVAQVLAVFWFLPSMLDGFFDVGLSMGLLALLGLGLLTGCFTGLFAGWLAWRSRFGLPGPLQIGAGWGIVELGRALFVLPNPFYLLGYSQVDGLLIQCADIAGIYGVSVLVAGGNGLLAHLWIIRKDGAQRNLLLRTAAPIVLVITAGLTYGVAREESTPSSGLAIRVAVIQGGLLNPQDYDQTKRGEVEKRYLELAGSEQAGTAQLLVYPEHALQLDLNAPDTATVRQLAAGLSLGREALIGGIYRSSHGDSALWRNSVFAVQNGKIVGRHDKVQLLPFAEDDLLRQLSLRSQVSFEEGDTLQPLPMNAGNVGVLICSEGSVPELARELVRHGAELLVNPSNDSWYGHSAPAWAALKMASVRAIETRRYLLRAAATGYSAIIDPNGRVIAASHYGNGKGAVLTANVDLLRDATLYQRWGNAPLYLVGLWLALAALPRRLSTRR